MFIERLTIRHYKSITKPFELHTTGKLHFFIGSNNSGKTNILDAIFQMFNEDDIRLLDDQTDISITFKIDKENTLEASQKGDTRRFELNKKIIATARAEKILSNGVMRICATATTDINRLKKDFNSLVSKYPKEYELFKNTIEKYIPKIQLSKNMLKIQEEGFNRPFERLGAGFQQVFKILLYLFHPNYRVLLLEEPEIHLHPALIKRLLHILQNKNLDNQIFLTTHSPLFINVQNIHRLFRVTKAGGTTQVHSPRLSGTRINYERLSQELNAENTEMFFADSVLLVEGPSDHILLRGMIDKFYEGGKDIKVIQMYGKSNADIYADLLDIFNIPYIVLLDRDALYDTGIKKVDHVVKGHYGETEINLITKLRKHSVHILPNGSIENNYPRKYQRRQKHKTQNAMYAVSRITKAEFNSAKMKNLKQVIDKLI